MARAALFDMDRTLVRKETASLYVRFQRDIGEASVRDTMRVLWWALEYTFGMIDVREVAARALLAFEGLPEEVLARRCQEMFERYVKMHISDSAKRVVREHRERGDVCAIVTGASAYATRPVAEVLDIEHLVTSELGVDSEGRLTGRLVEPLCYAEGKIERAEKLAKRLGFDLREATFYSDSYTDLPLLLHVREPVVVNPDPRLRFLAMRRGWRIEKW